MPGCSAAKSKAWREVRADALKAADRGIRCMRPSASRWQIYGLRRGMDLRGQQRTIILAAVRILCPACDHARHFARAPGSSAWPLKHCRRWHASTILPRRLPAAAGASHQSVATAIASSVDCRSGSGPARPLPRAGCPPRPARHPGTGTGQSQPSRPPGGRDFATTHGTSVMKRPMA